MGKPKSWGAMSKSAQYRYALYLVQSHRGQMVMAQVMEHGIKAMKAVPAPYTELSNIEDLEIIREYIFNFPLIDPDELQRLRNKAIKHILDLDEANYHADKVELALKREKERIEKLKLDLTQAEGAIHLLEESYEQALAIVKHFGGN